VVSSITDSIFVSLRSRQKIFVCISKTIFVLVILQAISMFNNQMLYERRMTVRMDRDAERIEPQSSRYLPEGLRSIGMGLGTRGDPLRDLPRIYYYIQVYDPV
jgi:hypothetical protein